jgi:hypothetical protein
MEKEVRLFDSCQQFYSRFNYITKQNDKRDRTERKCRYKTWDNDSKPHH